MYEKGKNIKKPRYNDQSTQEGRNKKKMVKSKKEKRLKLKNGPFATLKAFRILFPPDTPQQAVRRKPPNTILQCCLKLHDQQSNKSTTLCGITQQIPNKQKIILHISKAMGQ